MVIKKVTTVGNIYKAVFCFELSVGFER